VPLRRAAARLLTRYAAAEVGGEAPRGRALGLTLFPTSIRAVEGPLLLGPSSHLAQSAGLSRLSGIYVIAGLALLTAALTLEAASRRTPRHCQGDRPQPRAPHVHAKGRQARCAPTARRICTSLPPAGTMRTPSCTRALWRAACRPGAEGSAGPATRLNAPSRCYPSTPSRSTRTARAPASVDSPREVMSSRLRRPPRCCCRRDQGRRRCSSSGDSSCAILARRCPSLPPRARPRGMRQRPRGCQR
jgi:hypothetical protein